MNNQNAPPHIKTGAISKQPALCRFSDKLFRLWERILPEGGLFWSFRFISKCNTFISFFVVPQVCVLCAKNGTSPNFF
ncbi:MAG TPA: hypothetical protein DCY17_04330 [Clostridiales bacterium]|nr:hypothetical protein [Clostridiales bacterium]